MSISPPTPFAATPNSRPSTAPIILDGRAARNALIPGLMTKIATLSVTPTLAIIQVGNRPDSTAFIQAKKTFAAKIGVNEQHIHLPETISQQELETAIHSCNEDASIHGIILQLPLPKQIDQAVAIDAIAPSKDADALTSTNVKGWLDSTHSGLGRSKKILPATARGIRELLQQYEIALAGTQVVVVGKSLLVGRPIAAMCEQEGATVAVADRKTTDLAALTSKADILIVAAGDPGLIGAQHVKPGQVVVDVGITRNEAGALVGDVDFDAVKNSVSAITPVPGGVGPMTVLALFENVIDLCGV